MKNIVIVGGGFGGVGVAKRLAKKLPRGFHIILIDPSNYQTFRPDLYELITSNVSEVFGSLKIDFQELFSVGSISFFDIFLNDMEVEVIVDKVDRLDTSSKKVFTASGKEFSYEYLVLAAGGIPNFFGVDELREVVYTLNTVPQALNIRNSIDEIFAFSPKNKSISIVVVGGGFSGCEIAASLVEYLNQLSVIHGHSKELVSITIVEAGDILLDGASMWAQKMTLRRLQSLGVNIMFGSSVKGVVGDELIFQNSKKFRFDGLIWAAGVIANKLVLQLDKAELKSNNTVGVDKYLRALPYKEIFCLGDIAHVVDDRTEKPLPMTASVAVRQAKIVAENIVLDIRAQRLKKYKPFHPGFIIPLGGKYALADLPFVRFSGSFVWILKQLISLQYYLQVLGWRRGWKKWRSRIEVYI